MVISCMEVPPGCRRLIPRSQNAGCQPNKSQTRKSFREIFLRSNGTSGVSSRRLLVSRPSEIRNNAALRLITSSNRSTSFVTARAQNIHARTSTQREPSLCLHPVVCAAKEGLSHHHRIRDSGRGGVLH